MAQHIKSPSVLQAITTLASEVKDLLQQQPNLDEIDLSDSCFIAQQVLLIDEFSNLFSEEDCTLNAYFYRLQSRKDTALVASRDIESPLSPLKGFTRAVVSKSEKEDSIDISIHKFSNSLEKTATNRLSSMLIELLADEQIKPSSIKAFSKRVFASQWFGNEICITKNGKKYEITEKYIVA